MRYISMRGLVTLCVTAGSCACTERTPAVSRPHRPTMATRVAEASSTELSLVPGGEVVSSAQIRFDQGMELAKGIVRFRAWIPRDHWHPYQLAASDSTIILLGGFQSPDLMSISQSLARAHGSALSAMTLAEQLAVLADDNGGVNYIFPRRATAEWRSAWSAVAPPEWPGDTTIELPGGMQRVRLTILSQQTRSYAQDWVPTIYAFTFAPNRSLETWSRRSGTPIPARKLPTAPSAPSR